MTARSLTLFLLVALFPLKLMAAPDAPVLKAAGKVTFGKGYIDDRFALSADGKHLAYITVEAKGKAELHIRTMANSKEATFEITKITNEPKEIAFVPGKKMVVITLAAGKYNDYIFMDFTGKKLGTLKGLTDLLVQGDKVITYRRYAGNGMQIFTVSHYLLNKLRRPEKTMRLKGDVRGYVDIDKDKFAVAYFTHDYAKAVGKVIGKYDKKTDSKLVDTLGTYDLATKKLVKGTPISNTSIWDKEAYRFYRHPGYTNIIHLQGVPTVAGINGRFRVSQGPHKWTKVSYGFQLGRFEFSTLHQVSRMDSAGKLWFSMMVDPQNPITLKNLKSEKRYIHLFNLDPKSGKAVDAGRIPAPRGLITWKKGGNYVVIMRLSKFWTVGNETLEIYKLK